MAHAYLAVVICYCVVNFTLCNFALAFYGAIVVYGTNPCQYGWTYNNNK